MRKPRTGTAQGLSGRGNCNFIELYNLTNYFKSIKHENIDDQELSQ